MFDPLIIVSALVCGLLARSVGLPALIGYLAAGFLLHEFGAQEGALLPQLANMGVTLLLFSIGLKLKPADLLARAVWGTSLVHMLLTILVLAPILVVLMLVFASDHAFGWTQAIMIGFALSFSSTVFAIQVLQERGEMASRHATLAIGVLLMQDVAAVLYIGASTGKVPEWTALGLLLLIPGRPLIRRLLSMCGHGELFTLFGLSLAILGAEVFEAVGIKGDLGALILGALLAGDRIAAELSKNLLHFKDLFLVGFFVSIGLLGWPAPELILIAAILGVLAPLKAPAYFWLMARLHSEPRIAFLSSTALSNYSEFGLIVIAIAASQGVVDAQWSATLSLAIAVSFLFSSGLNVRVHALYKRWQVSLAAYRSPELESRTPDTSNVRVLILGMGRVGTGAYEAMRDTHGDTVIGVDENQAKLIEHWKQGRRVIDADASDPDFWVNIPLEDIEQVMLALTNHEENKLVGRQLRDLGYKGHITAVVRFNDQAEELKELGIESFNMFNQAGHGLARRAEELLAAEREEKATA